MHRRLLARLRRRLDASPLPAADRVRLDLEAELIAAAAPRLERRSSRVILVLHRDAAGDADTSAS